MATIGKDRLRPAKDVLLSTRKGVSAVIFGHTHHEIEGQAPGQKEDAGYFNTGTWSPSLDLSDQSIRERLR